MTVQAAPLAGRFGILYVIFGLGKLNTCGVPPQLELMVTVPVFGVDIPEPPVMVNVPSNV